MNNDDPKISLCVSVAVNRKDETKPYLLRISDANERRLVPFTDYSKSWFKGKSTPMIYHPPQYIPAEGTIGFWEWNSRRSADDPSRYRSISHPYPGFKWIEYLSVPGISSLEDLQCTLFSGIKINGDIDHDYLIAFSNNGETIQCVHCESKNFRSLKGKSVLNDNVYKLDVYEILKNDIGVVSLPDSYKRYNWNLNFQYYLNLDLPSRSCIVHTRTAFDTVKQVILRRIKKCAEGLPRKRRTEVKNFVEDCRNNIIDNIVAECDFTVEEAQQCYDEFRKEYEQEISADDIDIEIVQRLIDDNSGIAEKFQRAWEKKNTTQIQESQLHQKKLSDEINDLNSRKTKLTEEVSFLESEYSRKMKTADEVAEQIQVRISSAKQDLAAFFSEYAIFASPTPATPQTINKPQAVVCGKNVSDSPATITDIREILDCLCDNLEAVGVGITEQRKALGSYLLAAYFAKIPLLVAGYGATAIIDALSATLFNKTANRLYADCGNFDIADASEGITIAHDAFGVMNKILDKAGSGYVCFVSQTSEELAIEPRSLYNYALPLFVEYFISSEIKSMEFEGSIFNKTDDVKYSERKTRLPNGVLPSLSQKSISVLAGRATSLYKDLSEIDMFKLSTIPIMLSLQMRQELLELISKSNLSDGDKKPLHTIIGEVQ